MRPTRRGKPIKQCAFAEPTHADGIVGRVFTTGWRYVCFFTAWAIADGVFAGQCHRGRGWKRCVSRGPSFAGLYLSGREGADGQRRFSVSNVIIVSGHFRLMMIISPMLDCGSVESFRFFAESRTRHSELASPTRCTLSGTKTNFLCFGVIKPYILTIK